MKVGIILCARYRDCGGGKCFRAVRERAGGFARYPAEEPLGVVGYTPCGGCPGGNVEHVPVEFLQNGCEVVHLATGMVVGTHPIPQKYWDAHHRLSFWQEKGMAARAADLMSEAPEIRKAYD